MNLQADNAIVRWAHTWLQKGRFVFQAFGSVDLQILDHGPVMEACLETCFVRPGEREEQCYWHLLGRGQVF